MTQSIRKFALTAHVTASVGWAGALAVFLAHAIASLTSQDTQTVRAACLAMTLSAWFVILPLSLTSLLTGVIQAFGTAWGLFKHYWVVAKLLLTVFATAVLLAKLAPIDYLANASAAMTFSANDLVGLRASLLVHACGGLLVLFAITALAIYKPFGLTRFGVRESAAGAGTASRSKIAARTTPRWARVGFVVGIIALLMLLVILVQGDHGPGMHLPAH